MNKFPATVGEHWPGYDGLKRLFIFGASYCTVGYNTESPAPTEEQPLGVPFPGSTWTERKDDSATPNWVGYLITLRRKAGKKLLAYNYAVAGHTVLGVKQQVENWFLPHAGRKPKWACWTSEESLFMTWVGINDCAYSAEHGKDIENLFDLQEKLYQSGARNFLLIDVPPIHHSPAYTGPPVEKLDRNNTFFNWNSHLHEGAEAYHAKHPDISLFIFSSWDVFTKIIENPESFRFDKSDLKKVGGRIWMDRLHPTSRVHDILAKDLEKLLKGFQNAGGKFSKA